MLASLRLNREAFFQQRYQMDLTFVSIIVLAALIFVLSGMVGYLYWQQTHLARMVESMAMVLNGHLAPPPPAPEPSVPEQEDDVQEAEIAEDDRASVEEAAEDGVEHVDGPRSEVEEDIDDYQTKTSKQLQDILTKKGVPFGKRDSKTALLELLKAVA